MSRAAPRCEHREVLDIAGMRARIDAGASVGATWRHEGTERGAWLVMTPEGVRIEYWAGGIDLAPWHVMRLPLGGDRLWMGCPSCGRRCRVLYAGAEDIRCRLCLKLYYRSQNTRPAQRCLDRAEAIARKINPDPALYVGAALDGCPPRRRWMHRRTFHRLEAQFEHYAAMGMARLMRGIARAAYR